MNKRKKRILNILLVAVLVASLAAFGISRYNDYRSRQDYIEAVAAADGSHTEPETVPTISLPKNSNTLLTMPTMPERLPTFARVFGAV